MSLDQATKSLLDAVYNKCVWKAEQMIAHATFVTAALHTLHRDQVHVYRFMQMASSEAAEESLGTIERFLWEALPALSFRLNASALESVPIPIGDTNKDFVCLLEFYEACLSIADRLSNSRFKIRCLIQTGEMLRNVERLQESENTLRDALALCFSHLEDQSLEAARCYEGKRPDLTQ